MLTIIGLQKLRSKLFPAGTMTNKIYCVFLQPIVRQVLNYKRKIRITRNFNPQGWPVQSRKLARAPSSVRRIFLAKADHIGDLVICLPVFKLLRDTFLNAEITLACGEWNIGLAQLSGFFDQIVTLKLFPEMSQNANDECSLDHEDIIKLEQLEAFDIAIDLKIESGARAVLSHIKADYKAGYESSKAPPDMALTLRLPMFNNNAPFNQQSHTHQLLHMLASSVISNYTRSASLKSVLQTMAQAHDCLVELPPHSSRKYVGINAGAGVLTKKWARTRYAELAKRLIRDCNATIVLFGTKNEKSDSEFIADLCDGNNVINLTGRLSLPDFLSCAAQLDLYIGNDTGGTHIASGLGIPCICIFSGNGSLARFAPMGANTIIINRPLPCSDCGIKIPSACTRDMACLNGISVNDILKLAHNFLLSDPLNPSRDSQKTPTL